MNIDIKNAIKNGKLILLLGAGTSLSSKNKQGQPIMDGWGLAEKLAQEADVPYKNESLPVVYSAVRKTLGDRLNKILEAEFKHTKPSSAYETLAKYTWARIYTLNIDDCLDLSFRRNSQQAINIRHRYDKISDRSPFFDELDIVKLNGSIDRLDNGLIFSPQEYGAASANPPLWYEELSRDFFRYTFLFIGTKLSESLFYHQIERFRQATHSVEGRSFVLTRAATEIEKNSLQDLNLAHISGTFEDFVSWLTHEIPNPPKPLDIATQSHPQLKFLLSKKGKATSAYIELFESILKIGRAELSSHQKQNISTHRIRDFYRGFKPTWQEILDAVPSILKATTLAIRKAETLQSSDRLIVITGPAGSGKTTALMQVALSLSEKSSLPVYYLTEPIKNIRELLEALEETIETRYYFCIDRLSLVSDGIFDMLESGRAIKCIVIATERQNIWHSNTERVFINHCRDVIPLSHIDTKEAREILRKLEQYGPWHRLSKMTQKQREDELLKNSQRQLLIGLLETTSGHGFDKIIEKDYHDLHDNNFKKFVILIGLATIHRLGMPEEIASRALKFLGITSGIPSLLKSTSGIVKINGDTITARHQIYIERLFESCVSKEDKSIAIHALLHAFSAYSRPLIRSVGRNAGNIFKFTLNHNFLSNTLHNDTDLILNVFESFAKAFQDDGHFWLHYGLALRNAHKHTDALEKLRIARETYSLRQVDHAYAQQLLILAKSWDSKTIALAYLHEAKEILEELDKKSSKIGGDESDYPMVTLSDFHIFIINKLEGQEKAKLVAQEYSNILFDKMKNNPDNERLKHAWRQATTFATAK